MCSPLVTQCLDEPSASLLPAAPLPTRPRPCARHEYHRRKLRSTLTVPCVGAPTAMAGAERLSGAAARLRHRPPEPSSPVKAIEVHTAAPMAMPLDAPTSRAHRQGPRASALADPPSTHRRVDGEGRSRRSPRPRAPAIRALSRLCPLSLCPLSPSLRRSHNIPGCVRAAAAAAAAAGVITGVL